jgi:hypothetical protein
VRESKVPGTLSFLAFHRRLCQLDCEGALSIDRRAAFAYDRFGSSRVELWRYFANNCPTGRSGILRTSDLSHRNGDQVACDGKNGVHDNQLPNLERKPVSKGKVSPSVPPQSCTTREYCAEQAVQRTEEETLDGSGRGREIPEQAYREARNRSRRIALFIEKSNVRIGIWRQRPKVIVAVVFAITSAATGGLA